ncbi:MAG: AMP-binding protein [Actinomycetota bacterium]
MTATDRPWLSSYRKGTSTEIKPEFTNALDMFKAAVRRNPDLIAIKYFDGTVSVAELDAQSTALAAGLLANGFQKDDRLAVYLQNVPQFLVAMLAAWKAGGVMVSVNPMNRSRELDYMLKDSGATVLLCLENLYSSVAKDVVPGTSVRSVITTSELDYQTRHDPRLFKDIKRERSAGTVDMLELIAKHRGETVPDVTLAPNDVAFLTYTSGTTGVPKGARNTHSNVVFNSQAYRDWIDLSSDEVILGVAPLFHITGLVSGATVSFLLPATLVLAYRFDPGVMLDCIREHRPTFTVGAITVFIALSNAAGVEPADFASLNKIYSGGAAIAPAIADAFQARFGHQIHNIYGLTETTSPSHAVPLGAAIPVDPTSGALSVGVPIFDTVVRIVDENGNELPAGEIGELVTEGPQVVDGYWNKPEETAKSIPNGRLYTGDVGFMDANGWFYIVDRKKDMINASGYKVWPREVEDVLYGHPSVREAAVIGVPDEYRGESVKAFVSLKPGTTATPEEIQAFCKERMAAYKYPRQVEIVDELPKTVTGKILRRELRDTK